MFVTKETEGNQYSRLSTKSQTTVNDSPESSLPPLPNALVQNVLDEEDAKEDEENGGGDKLHPLQIDPVGRKVIKEEILQNETYFRYFLRLIKTYFVSHIPIEVIRGLPRSYKYIFGSLAYMLSLSIYSYYIYYNFTSFYNTEYITLKSSSGSVCSAVSIPVHETYLADRNGYWEGQRGFSYPQSIFTVRFADFTISSESQFNAMMNTFSQELTKFSKTVNDYDLALQVVGLNAFMRTYSLRYPHQVIRHKDFVRLKKQNDSLESLQRFYFNASPTLAYTSDMFGFAFGLSSGRCNLSQSSSYDDSAGEYKATFPTAELLASIACKRHFPIPLVATNPRFNHLLSSISISLDVQSVTTALGVNFGMTTLADLISVSIQPDLITYHNTIYYGEHFIDLRYPEMKPIYCLYAVANELDGDEKEEEVAASPPLCLTSIRRGVFLPVTNHLGSRFDVPERCNCSHPVNASSLCNDLNLMLSVIVYPGPVSDGPPPPPPPASSSTGTITVNKIDVFTIINALDLFYKYDRDYQALNEVAYPATATTVLQQLVSSGLIENQNQSLISSNHTELFQFCAIRAGEDLCAVITFFTLDTMQQKVISNYQSSLLQGACQNTLSVSSNTWQQLTATPPTSFTEPYYECYPSIFRTILYATGVANGVTNLTMFALLCILLPIVYITLACWKGVPPPAEYSKVTKSIALDSLATVLLRVQDSNYEGIDPEGVIDLLAKELIRSVQYTETIERQGSMEMNYSNDMGRSFTFDRADGRGIHDKVEPYLEIRKASERLEGEGENSSNPSPFKQTSIYAPSPAGRSISLNSGATNSSKEWFKQQFSPRHGGNSHESDNNNNNSPAPRLGVDRIRSASFRLRSTSLSPSKMSMMSRPSAAKSSTVGSASIANSTTRFVPRLETHREQELIPRHTNQYDNYNLTTDRNDLFLYSDIYTTRDNFVSE